jgi:hypothetical protein
MAGASFLFHRSTAARKSPRPESARAIQGATTNAADQASARQPFLRSDWTALQIWFAATLLLWGVGLLNWLSSFWSR